ncbi:hypothetical protein V6N13_123985 [Hibiscus sabdariffa]
MVPAIQSVPALERPTSPTLVQEQPVSKKNKTATIDGDVVQEMVMDTTDDVLPSHMRNMAFHGEHGTGNAGDANTDLGKNESYASMAAKSRGDEERDKSAATLTDEEVIILEDDNLGTIWGSRFAALEVSDDNGLPGSTGEIAHSVTRTMEADVHSGESRQAPPRMVMHKNSAYVASNPEKKSRNGRKMTSSPAVLPIVEGQEATVVSWKAQGQGGNHTAVLIQEQNEKGLAQSMSRGGR